VKCDFCGANAHTTNVRGRYNLCDECYVAQRSFLSHTESLKPAPVQGAVKKNKFTMVVR